MMFAKALTETDDTESATRILKKLIRNKAGYDPAYKLYMEINGDESIKYFASVYELDQFEERPLIWQAQTYFNSGDYKQAKRIIKKAISIDPSDGEQGVGDRMRAYSILADVLEKEGDIKTSSLYQDAIKAIRLSEQADKYNKLGLYSIAIDKYREATTLMRVLLPLPFSVPPPGSDSAYLSAWLTSKPLHSMYKLFKLFHIDSLINLGPIKNNLLLFVFPKKSISDHPDCKNSSQKILCLSRVFFYIN